MTNFKYLMTNVVISGVLMITIILSVATQTFAHVVVRPAEVGVGARTNFVVSVPTEEDVPTTQVRILIPNGITNVRPNAKAGWNIEIKRFGESMKGPVLNTGMPAPDPEQVSEIIWSGGSIGANLRDEFVFSAMAPTNQTSLQWRAYQTYANGEVVAWDADPQTVVDYEKNNPNAPDDDHNAPKPFSVTEVKNDLVNASAKPEAVVANQTDKKDSLTMVISSAALLLSAVAIFLQLRAKKN